LNLDPIKEFQDLSRPAGLPKIFQEKGADPEFLKYYVLVHDKSQPTDMEQAQGILKQMQQTFGVGCCGLITLNSVPLEQPDGGKSSLWAQSPAGALSAGEAGTEGFKG